LQHVHSMAARVPGGTQGITAARGRCCLTPYVRDIGEGRLNRFETTSPAQVFVARASSPFFNLVTAQEPGEWVSEQREDASVQGGQGPLKVAILPPRKHCCTSQTVLAREFTQNPSG
jgi:hypothetical protein